ncbi:hypothetical protein B0H15DRAFT_955076 [Mycena belliarum]|uniref:Uncharacterized protein n=1 Tax=Mycena belliarum TaxID=1033014 RepID=A0AAD6TS27_9AGAR|nr:hypothetical protein B0H15DRAFT_955076 [Mycena belliae]
MATPIPMPARGDRNAPTFDPAKPHELRRYFTDLEFLFGRAAVTDSTEKKQHATRFLAVEDQETWEALPAFGDATKSYEIFKADVLKLYSGNDEERRFGLNDLDALVGHYSRTGIYSKTDLTTFYRQFLRITTYLVSKNRLSASEQSRSFMRAMQPVSTLAKIEQRLQIKKPDVHPEDPYDIGDIYEAAQFVLAGSTGTLSITSLPTSASAPASAPTDVKPDPGITALVGTMAELIKVLAMQNGSKSNSSSYTKPPRPDGCGYCSELDHFINQCPHVLVDVQAGKCRRNVENRVVLPSGAFVPRTITGKDLRSRIEEWHRQNPGQLAAAQLLVEVAATPPTPPAAPAVRTFSLTDAERMEALKAEYQTLLTRAQAKKALAENNNQQEEPDRTIPAPKSPTPVAPAAPVTPAPVPGIIPMAPPHPFAAARDAAYAPPKDRNFGLAPQKPAAAYRTNTPIYNEKDAAEVLKASLDSPITITHRQLFSIAPEVRAGMREETTSRRFAPKDPKTPQLFHGMDDPFPQFTFEAETVAEQHARESRYAALLDSLPASYAPTVEVHTLSELPADAFIVPDPYAIYYDSGTLPDDLIVSMESSAIRSILPIIDNREQVECIVDGGSQIIAMAESVCHDLALSYDPRIVLRMQSATGSVSPSLGLARNVPFRIGDITLYLQVHIVRNPAYDVLLGRPFDVLTQSIVRNFANEDQTITICDPNTGKLATVPTVPRGPPRSRPQGFPNSRN